MRSGPEWAIAFSTQSDPCTLHNHTFTDPGAPHVRHSSVYPLYDIVQAASCISNYPSPLRLVSL